MFLLFHFSFVITIYLLNLYISLYLDVSTGTSTFLKLFLSGVELIKSGLLNGKRIKIVSILFFNLFIT